MKVIPFHVPQTTQEAFRIQTDRLPHFYDKLHEHDETQIMLIQKSQGTLIAGDHVGRFKEGDMFLIGGGQPHVFRNDESYYKHTSSKQSISSGRQAHSVSLYFDENYAGESFWQLAEMSAVRKFLAGAGTGYKILGNTRTAIAEMIGTISKSRGIDKLMTFLTILKKLSESSEVVRLSVSNTTFSIHASEGKRMNDILEFTFGQSARKIYLDEIAAIASLSPEAFCRYFKLRTGKTYTSFLNEVRISNACQMLIRSGKSIQEVCFQSGFRNLSHFNRVFRKITGQTPKKYSRLPA
jgi:AraC-like DNA-binding protein